MMKGLCNDYGKVFQQYVFNHIYTWVVTRYPGEMTFASCASYPTLWVTHAPAMMFSPPPLVSDPDIHHGTCVTHVPWCIPGSLTSDFLWSRLRGKRSRRMRKRQFYVSGMTPMQHVQMRRNIYCWYVVAFLHTDELPPRVWIEYYSKYVCIIQNQKHFCH